VKSIPLPETFSSWLRNLESSSPIRVYVESSDEISAAAAALIGAAIASIASLAAVYLNNRHQRQLAKDQRADEWRMAVARRQYDEMRTAIADIQAFDTQMSAIFNLVISHAIDEPVAPEASELKGLDRVTTFVLMRADSLLPVYRRAADGYVEFFEGARRLAGRRASAQEIEHITKSYFGAQSALTELSTRIIFLLPEVENYPPQGLRSTAKWAQRTAGDT
jgi:hypothetical protein